jgi:hypothetical protein
MSNSVIRAELETRLKAWADAQVPKIPIAPQGASFTKPLSGGFLEPLLLPNGTINNDLSGKRKTHVGIFEVRCWSPSGRGMGDVEKLSNNVINLFPLLPKTGSVSVENTPYSERPEFDTSGWIIVPVLILYRYES